MERIIDLHTHSTASDGTDTPEELMHKAKESGLSAIALTDHDNFGGIKKAQQKANEIGIELIKGIELSSGHTTGEVHILGYWLTEEAEKHIYSKQLEETFIRLKSYRDERNEEILKKLKQVGVTLTLDDVLSVMSEAAPRNEATCISDMGYMICRPHFALAMMKKGYVSDIRTAFSKYLGDKGLAHVPKKILTQQEAVEILRESKAFVVLAHPYLINVRNAKERKELIKKLKDYGLHGIETYYSMNNKDQTMQTLMYAKEFNLAVTGGSDYHGMVKPHISLAKGQGNLNIPYSVLEEIREYAKKIVI